MNDLIKVEDDIERKGRKLWSLTMNPFGGSSGLGSGLGADNGIVGCAVYTDETETACEACNKYAEKAEDGSSCDCVF